MRIKWMEEIVVSHKRNGPFVPTEVHVFDTAPMLKPNKKLPCGDLCSADAKGEPKQF